MRQWHSGKRSGEWFLDPGPVIQWLAISQLNYPSWDLQVGIYRHTVRHSATELAALIVFGYYQGRYFNAVDAESHILELNKIDKNRIKLQSLHITG